MIQNYSEVRNLLKFCKQCDSIFIYGAREAAWKVCRILEMNNIDIEACIVSNKNENQSRCMGHQVRDIEEIGQQNGAGVLLCLDEKFHQEIICKLETLGFQKFFAVKEQLLKEIILEMSEYPVITLLYHRVAELATDPHMLAVSPKNFEAHIKYLKENFSILSFEDPWENRDSPAFVVTFDDGYLDNFDNALPILQKYDIPATIFVSTQNIDMDKEFWWDELERMLLLNPALPNSVSFTINQDVYEFSLRNCEEIERCHKNLHSILLNVEGEKRKNAMYEIKSQFVAMPPCRGNYRIMSTAELKQVEKSSRVTIGAHTVTHTKLAEEKIDRQRWEIAESKSALEKILEKEIKCFSYPFGGKADYMDQTVDLLSEIGIKKAASNFPGVTYSWTNPLEIPRNLVRDCQEAEFRAILNELKNKTV